MQIKDDFFKLMNQRFQSKEPFFFISDFLNEKNEIVLLSELSFKNIYFQSPLHSFLPKKNPLLQKINWHIIPMDKSKYTSQFLKVQSNLQAGNSYLVNLTCENEVKSDASLFELFCHGDSLYKLFYKDQFIHFSPEPFIRIKDGRISAFPMKGTIDANVPNAERIVLQNVKELNEQYTIVDLIRNDLNIVAEKVRVDRFRYVEHISTNRRDILAVSSEISGNMRPEYCNNPGDIFSKILPAGSICGAPKPATLKIIQNSESHIRSWYTGVWGVFDGVSIDSCVIIRYLEKRDGKYYFKSGGGITSMSEVDAEYQEMLDKIYVPIH